MASTCEGDITLAECTKALSMMQNNKSPGSGGLTTEFYRAFCDIISTYVVNSFNYTFITGNLSISQRQGIISLIPKKKKDTQYLKNWRPVTLLNVDDKIATKTIALRIEKGTSTFDQSHSNRLRKRKVHRRKHQIDFRYNGIH